MSRLVPQDAHAPLVLAAFDLEHLGLLEPGQPRMRHIKGDGDGGGAVGREPFVRQVEVQRERQPPRGELLPQLLEPIGQRVLDGDRQIRHPDVQERFIIKIRPVGAEGETRHRQGS
jgi:hypothetical protein